MARGPACTSQCAHVRGPVPCNPCLHLSRACERDLKGDHRRGSWTGKAPLVSWTRAVWGGEGGGGGLKYSRSPLLPAVGSADCWALRKQN